MTGKNITKSNESAAIAANDREDLQGAAKGVGGSQFDEWNRLLVVQIAKALSADSAKASELEERLKAAVCGLAGIGPKDELEGMMAAKLVVAHEAEMDCHHRAQNAHTPAEQRQYLNMANKLSRTSATLLGALDKHRGKGQQKVTVEHVHVHDGAQAVIGNIERSGGGGVTVKSEEQPHAK